MKNKREGLKKHTTNINEVARERLGITRDEYALCQYVQYRLADTRGKKSGWCSDTKAEIAEFIGITRPGIYKMLDRMEVLSLLEIESSTGFCRVTSKWIDTEQNRKQSLQPSVNKVDTKCKQSLQPSVNKVTLNIEEKDIEKEEREGESAHTPAPVEIPTVKAEEVKRGLVAPPPPPAEAAAPFSTPKRVDTVDEAESIIMEWATTEVGRGSVRKWYSDAARKCTAADVTAMVSKFCGVYLTIGDEGKRQRMAQDPLQFFKYTFKLFLKNEKSHELRPGASAFNQQQAPSNIPSSLQGLIGK